METMKTPMVQTVVALTMWSASARRDEIRMGL